PALVVAIKPARHFQPQAVQVLQQCRRRRLHVAAAEHAIPPLRHFLRAPYLGTSGSPITLSSSAITSSLVLPSACAWKLVLMRCRSTGPAAFLMSSRATLKRPSIAAIALAP